MPPENAFFRMQFEFSSIFIASARAERIVMQATNWSKQDPNIVESQVAMSKLIADDLKENNLFFELINHIDLGYLS